MTRNKVLRFGRGLVLGLMQWAFPAIGMAILIPIWIKFRDEHLNPDLLGWEPVFSVPFTYGELIVAFAVGMLGYPFFGWLRLRLEGKDISFGDHLNSLG